MRISNYTVNVPFLDDMGSISPFVVHDSFYDPKENQALWEINRMRDHDGLPHLSKLPRGTKFTRQPKP